VVQTNALRVPVFDFSRPKDFKLMVRLKDRL
jgi:hypothetical protein